MLIRSHELVPYFKGVGLVADVIRQVGHKKVHEPNEHDSRYDPAQSRASFKVHKVAILRQVLLSLLIEPLLEEALSL